MRNPTLVDEKVKKWGYQEGFNYGYSCRREAVLHRDGYTCQCCGKKNRRLEVHHIIFRSNGGTDDENNLITLCEGCHKKVHDSVITLDKKPKKMNLKYATHMSIIRSQLLKKYPDAIETFGFVKSENRAHLGLEKSHYIDACVIAGGGLPFELSDMIYYKRRVSKGNYRLTKGIWGGQRLPTGKFYGLRKLDKVEYLGEKYFIYSRNSFGYVTLTDIFGNKIKFNYMPNGYKTPKMSNCKRTSARRSSLCKKEGEILWK